MFVNPSSHLIPIDVVLGANNDSTLRSIFIGVFVTSAVLGWLLIPAQQLYFDSGAFTFRRRMRHVARQLALFGVAAIVVLIAFVIYLAATSQLSHPSQSVFVLRVHWYDIEIIAKRLEVNQWRP